jgi:hypothetical protein
MKKAIIFATTALIIIAAVVILIMGSIVGLLTSKLDIKSQEDACKLANKLGQTTGLDGIHHISQSACHTIRLGTLPQKGYTDKEIKKNIADKAAETKDIWLEGVKENYFEGNAIGKTQKCFIQYTFEIKKDTDPIYREPFIKYLSDTLYTVDDTSQRCHGTKGGWCRDDCLIDEDEVKKPINPCPSLDKCCLKQTPCESKGGECLRFCSGNYESHISLNWACSRNDVCCVDQSNYVTYLEYLQANTAKLVVTQDTLYPQDYGTSPKISETYAIVFVSRTTSFWKEPADNINGIIIAKLNEVSKECEVQLG